MTSTRNRGADRLVWAMDQAGVDVVFSLSGNQIMPVYDAFNDFDIRVIHTRHEAAAVFMAEAYAQIGDQVGVALVTAAPGFGNALGALYTAAMSEAPVIFLSGDSPVGQDGMGAFQQFDQVAAASPFVKSSVRMGLDDDPAAVFSEAIHTAQSGVPGPVHIALPFDVLNAEFSGDVRAPITELDQLIVDPTPALVAEIISALSAAKRPLILAGPHLFRGDRIDQATILSNALDAPVLTLDSPRGLRDPAHGAIKTLFEAADCVFYLGKPVDFTSGFGALETMPNASMIVVSEDDYTLKHSENLLGDRLGISGKSNLIAMIEILVDQGNNALERKTWRDKAEQAIGHRHLSDRSSNALYSKLIIDTVADGLSNDTILICDGGEFGQWAQGFVNRKRRITNGPSGAIGGSLPYAIGAKIARPDLPVVALMGDGTAGFHFTEFETAAREGLDITIIIGNDSRWNAEHHIQLRDYGEERTLGCELADDVRYDIAAQGLGCSGIVIEELSDLASALAEGLDTPKPYCINVLMPGAPAPQYAAFEIGN